MVRTTSSVPLTVLHIPHGADVIPDDVRRSFIVSDACLYHERRVSTDWFTSELFGLPPSEATTVLFPVSRLVLDPERFLDDASEPLASRGRGVVYTHTVDGRPLRGAAPSWDCAALVETYYSPHHERLTAAVQAALDYWGQCLLVDCHSFPSQPLPCDLDQSPDRPDICLGTDPVHTPTWLLDIASSRFAAAGLSVAVDRPYAGVLVPQKHAGTTPTVFAVMVEINRRLYLNEATGTKRLEFAEVATMIAGVLRDLRLAAEALQPWR